MASMTQSKPRIKASRTARVAQVGTATVLWLSQDRDITAYRVESIPCDFGRAAFRLHKADKGDGEPAVYDVLLDGADSRCDCRGFERHGMCKDGKGCRHVAGLTAALDAGALSPAPRAQKPAVAQLDAIDAEALAEGEAAALTQPEPWDDL
jgi:hypothetical protein